MSIKKINWTILAKSGAHILTDDIIIKSPFNKDVPTIEDKDLAKIL